MICQELFQRKNGSHKISSQEILVHFPEEDKTIEVEKYEWQNIRYKIDPATKEIEEEVLGTFVHYRLSWLGQLRCIKPGLTLIKPRLIAFLPGQAMLHYRVCAR
jgi:hypothetical protein